MELRDIRAAIAELDRQRKRLAAKIENRERQARERQAEADGFKRELGDVVDRWMALIAEEQKIVRPGSVE